MAWKSKGQDPKDAAVVAAQSEADKLREENAKLRGTNVSLIERLRGKKTKEEPDTLSALLSMEIPARELALNYPDGPNCDAVKSALTNAAHGIAHVRKALQNNGRLA